MTTPLPPRARTRPRRALFRSLLALPLAALLLAGPMVGAAAAAPSSPSTPSPHPSSTSKAPPPKPKKGITWAVQPSTAKGPDGRSTFTWTNVKPRTVLHDYVGVSNFSSRPVTFQVYATDAFVTKSGGIDMLPAAERPTDVGSWVTLPHRTIRVPAHARVNEPYTLTVPSNATPGDHTGGMLASLLTTGQVKLDQRIAVPIYLRVSGKLNPTLSIESTGTSYHGTVNPFGGGGTNVSYTVHNTGNVRLTGTQTVSVTGPFGITLATAHPAPLLQLLPGNSIGVSTHLSGVFPAGPLTVHIRIKPVPINGLRHTTGAPLATVSHNVGMWALPWPQLVLLILLLGGGFGAWCWVRRRRQNHRAALAAAVEKGRREATLQPAQAESNGHAELPTAVDSAKER
jgi:hypothetical protein